jgi:hypothetical protein
MPHPSKYEEGSMIKKTYAKQSLVAAALMLLAACSGSGEAADAPGTSSSAASAPVTAAPLAAPATYTLAVGTRLDAALVDSIHSRVARAGDAFTARVVGDVPGSAAGVAIPAGSVVDGTILAVSPAQNERSTGTLTLAVSRVSVRGMSYPLAASIDSLDTMHQERGIEGVDAARVAGGAVAGAVLGRVIGGGTQGAVIGGVAGGVAGAVVSVVMKDMDIVLPVGSHLMLTLQEPLTVTASSN